MQYTSTAWQEAVALGVPPHFAISIYEDKLAAAEQAIQRVRKLHKRDEEWHQNGRDLCSECRAADEFGRVVQAEYPCPTIKALDGEQ